MSERPLSEGDILTDEDTGSVYIFKRLDTMGRIVVWDCQSRIKVLEPIPPNLWRYDRDEHITLT